MQIIHTVADYRVARRAMGEATVGFVPTMGALHRGHESLVARSVETCDATVVSVYVNPTQFDNPDDLDHYPRMLEQDAKLAGDLGADVLFAPDYREMYPDGFRYQVDETGFSRQLCGAHRPGHFTGVLTVVMKLLNIVKPTHAFFGEKDYQQLQLIRDMVNAFFMDAEIIGCPTVREPDGLALSSRNLNLDAASRKKAPLLHELIMSDADDETVAAELSRAGFRVEYVSSRYGRRFVAARIGEGEHEVRLIDNVARATDSTAEQL